MTWFKLVSNKDDLLPLIVGVFRCPTLPLIHKIVEHTRATWMNEVDEPQAGDAKIFHSHQISAEH